LSCGGGGCGVDELGPIEGGGFDCVYGADEELSLAKGGCFGCTSGVGNSGWGRWRGERLPKWSGRADAGTDELGGVDTSRIRLKFGCGIGAEEL
jgi:hypothetical protein